MDLIASLIREQGSRLCSRRYRYMESERLPPFVENRTRLGRGHDWTGRAVYSHDAEDIKAHKWFRDLPWDRLHQLPPPFIPQISSLEDTHYFDEEEAISDWSDSESESTASQDNMASSSYYPLAPAPGSSNVSPPTLFGIHGGGAPGPTSMMRRSRSSGLPLSPKAAAMQAQLAAFPPPVRAMMAHFVATPYDAARLKRMDKEMEAVAVAVAAQENNNNSNNNKTGGNGNGNVEAAAVCATMKTFVRAFGRRERKRPRDRVLRDRGTRGVALQVRKQTAFLGYTYRRRRKGGSNNRCGVERFRRWEERERVLGPGLDSGLVPDLDSESPGSVGRGWGWDFDGDGGGGGGGGGGGLGGEVAF